MVGCEECVADVGEKAWIIIATAPPRCPQRPPPHCSLAFSRTVLHAGSPAGRWCTTPCPWHLFATGDGPHVPANVPHICQEVLAFSV